MSHDGKRLMILGGNPETGVLVRLANALGIYTIVVDPNPSAPAKRFASEHHEMDGFDVDGIVVLAGSLGVDGVLVGVADVLVAPYYEICSRLGLPCYAAPPTISAFTTKDGFRSACNRFGVRDIPGVVVAGAEAGTEFTNMTYPAMLKPVDSGGGVGMHICYTPSELKAQLGNALGHSKSGRVLIERYMQHDDMFAYYTLKDGTAYLSATADRITTKKQSGSSPVCIAARYPSTHTDAFVELAHPGIVHMLEGLGVSDGVLNIQFFVDRDRFYAYDPGFRLQGEAPHIYLSHVNGFDHRRMLIDFALSGSMGVEDFEQRNDFLLHGKRACTFWVLIRSGTVGTIEGFDALRGDPNVIFIQQRLNEGDTVTTAMAGTERQVLARIFTVADSGSEVSDVAERLRRALRVTDDRGNDMIVDWVNATALVESG